MGVFIHGWWPTYRPRHWSLAVTTPPTLNAISLEDARDWLYVRNVGQDTVIQAIVKAATSRVEVETNRKLLTQTLKLTVDGPPSGTEAVSLMTAPVASVTSIVSYDTLDSATTMPTTDYVAELTSEPARVRLSETGDGWPTALRLQGSMEITFVAGATSPDLVPADLKMAIRLLVLPLFERRGLTDEEQRAYNHFISGWRLDALAA